jgi:peptide-methionine (S)-S-oxide reductase
MHAEYDFSKLKLTKNAYSSQFKKQTTILAGGCFWGMQALIRKLPGVLSSRVGYSGGDIPHATYEHHGTHAEALEIAFDPEVLPYRALLEYFFQIHDPTTLNRQGHDRGTSYRSAIFYTTPDQRDTALETIADIDASGLWPGRVVTEVKPAGPFWVAEAAHQDYLEHFPEGYTCHYPRPEWVLPQKKNPELETSDIRVQWAQVMDWAHHGNPSPPRRVEKTDEEWKALLSAEQYRITRQKGTQAPDHSAMCTLFEPGRYHCVCCDTSLFDASTKFHSGTGWPSFTQPLSLGVVAYHGDASHGMNRVEATCGVCDAHLGHVFPDGPPPSGLRYCINAVALKINR